MKNDNAVRNEQELKKLLFECKDEEQFNSLFDELRISHYKSAQPPVELIVPCSDVTDVIDFGACKISRTIRGFLIEAKGGMFTFVKWNMKSVCDYLDALFSLYHKENKTTEENEILDSYQSAILYCFQALIFGTMSEVSLFTIAAEIMKEFRRFFDEKYSKGQQTELTEQDYKADAEYENMTKGFDNIVGSSTHIDDSL